MKKIILVVSVLFGLAVHSNADCIERSANSFAGVKVNASVELAVFEKFLIDCQRVNHHQLNTILSVIADREIYRDTPITDKIVLEQLRNTMSALDAFSKDDMTVFKRVTGGEKVKFSMGKRRRNTTHCRCGK